MKKIFFLIKLLCLMAITFAGLELISYFSLSDLERKMPVSQLMDRFHNQYLKDFNQKSGCSFAETIISHPMLGFVHRQKEYLPSRCKNSLPVNNIGMISTRDLPLRKKTNEFAVLIVGGSVAQQFADYKGDGRDNYFERWLNDHYVSPNKGPFRVYSGAIGAWSMPNQLNMLLMYGERVDAIVALDGYNEGFAVQEGRRLEQVPAATYVLANSSVGGPRSMGLNIIWAHQYLLSHFFLKYSYFFNISYKLLIGIYQRHFLPKEVLDEFSLGNTENLDLGSEEAKAWALSGLERYIVHFHALAKMNNIKTAQFMQPSRLMNKELTPEEKIHEEYIAKETYQKIDRLYNNLSAKGLPIFSLSPVFAGHKERIYADHIHYLKTDGRSLGNELIAQKMAQVIEKFWGLKRRPR